VSVSLFEKIGELHASGGVYAFTATGSAIYNAGVIALAAMGLAGWGRRRRSMTGRNLGYG